MAELTAERFAEVRSADLAAGHGQGDAAIVRWEISERFHHYDGAPFLLQWLEWLHEGHGLWNPSIGGPLPEAWLEASRAQLGHVLQGFGQEIPDPWPYGHVDRYNASDLLLQTGFRREWPGTVLDFGAGMARQSLLWTTVPSGVTYIAVDAIEGPYLLQRAVLEALPDVELIDYMDDPEGFSIEPAAPGLIRAYHLPTWRLDLVPAGTVDLILCVQVLQELNAALVRFAIAEFARMVAADGRLFIRDHEFWRPAHKLRISRLLGRTGWRLAARQLALDKVDTHGIARHWVRDAAPKVPLMGRVGLGLDAFRNPGLHGYHSGRRG